MKDATSKNLQLTRPNTIIMEATRVTRRYGIGGFPVGETDHLTGMLSFLPSIFT
jgi:predicted transcriptional regulator